MLQQDADPAILVLEDRQEVERHLNSLLASSAFNGSRRSQEFLRYIVEEYLAGRGASIKERNIAVDVFGKGQDFDAQSDSLVRVKAAEVRKRLTQAYQSPFSERVRIQLPVGHYQPVLSFLQEEAPVPVSVEEISPVVVAAPARRTWRYLGFSAGGILVAGLIVAGTLIMRQSRPDTDRIWDPFTLANKPVLISLPSPNVLTWREHLRLSAAGATPSTGSSAAGEGHYVGVGAAEGAAKFGEQLALRHQSFFLKFGSDVSFSDLQRSPAILLGASSSPWTLDLVRGLRFRFAQAPAFGIVDAENPKTFWRAELPANDEPRMGYALISRLLRPESGNVVLMAAGIDPHDTQSAVEFLTREEYFDQFAKQAPGWAAKNFQLVIRTYIHGHTPSRPQLIMYKTW